MLYSGNISNVKFNFNINLWKKICEDDFMMSIQKSNFQLNMLLIDNFPNMTNFENGFSYFLNVQSINIDFLHDYEYTINFQNNRLITDEGVFFPTLKE